MNFVHGHCCGDTRSPTYESWQAMIGRCIYPANASYRNYGALGITVCARWRRFENFLADMGERPPGMSIDRIDSERGYKPGNCRWATPEVQHNHRRNNVLISAAGTTLTVAQWARKMGLRYSTIRMRLQSGWPPAEAVTAPLTNAWARGSRT